MLATLIPGPVGVEGGPPPVTVEGRLLLPSPEAVKETIDTVTKAVLSKMAEMEAHVKEAVSEMPLAMLEKIAGKVKAGEDFQLRRRHGCVSMDFGTGDDEFHLRL